MLTGKCQTVIDEAITANGNLAKLSAESLAHLESCLECRRSLESIKALEASVKSVIPITAAGLALKSKIASSLEGSMLARSGSTLAKSAAKSSFGSTPIILSIGLASAVTCGVLCLNNNNGMTSKPSNENSSTYVNSLPSIATNTVELGSNIVVKGNEVNKKVKSKINNIIPDNDSNFEIEEEEHYSNNETLPSVIEDIDDISVDNK